MWVSDKAQERIRELETNLANSVPRDVYERSLARIADLERRVDWQSDVILLKAGRQPLPVVKAEGEQPAQVQPPAVSEASIAQAEAIMAEGKRLNMTREEIASAIQSQTGLTYEVLAAAINGNGNHA